MQAGSKWDAFLAKYSLWCLILLTSIFIFSYYSPIIFGPSDLLLNDKGDAIKNYFAYEWHVHNDSSFASFSGLNYPYGEYHGYADGNQLLSNFIRLAPFLKDHSIAIFNLSIVFSFLICAIMLFKILLFFDVHHLFSIVAAFGITILCPQVFRTHGHFTLSYGFCIPTTIYLLLLYKKTVRQRLSLIMCLMLICFYFIHPYLGLMCSLLIGIYWLIELCIDRKREHLLPFMLQGIIPVVFYLSITNIFDTKVDRPTDPYGFLYFTARIESVFISTHPPFRHLLSQIYKIKEQNWEGLAYVGITTLITLLSLPFFWYKNRDVIKDRLSNSSRAKISMRMVIASLVLLLFAMGYPFKWNMEWLLEKLPLVKQFRAPGRFAWVFYFVATITSTVFISKFIFRKESKITWVVTAILLLLFAIEGIPFHNALSKDPFVKNHFKRMNIDMELMEVIFELEKGRPQALIPLPFFHIGSDVYDMEGTQKSMKSAFIASYHSKVPIMASFSARSSLSEAKKLVSIIKRDEALKELMTEVDMKRTFYVFYTKEKLTIEERTLLERGRVIIETPNYLLKELIYNELF